MDAVKELWSMVITSKNEIGGMFKWGMNFGVGTIFALILLFQLNKMVDRVAVAAETNAQSVTQLAQVVTELRVTVMQISKQQQDAEARDTAILECLRKLSVENKSVSKAG